MDYQSVNSGLGLNHNFDREKYTDSLTDHSEFGNRHSIWENSTDYPKANSEFGLNHNFDQERQDIGDEIMSNLHFEELNIDYSVPSNGIVGIQTQEGDTRYLDQKPLMINVLTQGKELLNQLRIHLNPSSSTGEFLIETMLSSFNKTLSILNSSVSETEIQPIRPISSILDSPRSINGSPQSDHSNRRDMYKKGKTLSQWTKHVRVRYGTDLNDDHSWKKYGQKDILGAEYPREYYRCLNFIFQRCLATKQVQRSEDDPSFFEITYHKKHSCIPVSSVLGHFPPPNKQN